jgi:ribosomal protein S14
MVPIRCSRCGSEITLQRHFWLYDRRATGPASEIVRVLCCLYCLREWADELLVEDTD